MLALGNGAPDVFSTFAGIQVRGYRDRLAMTLTFNNKNYNDDHDDDNDDLVHLLVVKFQTHNSFFDVVE